MARSPELIDSIARIEAARHNAASGRQLHCHVTHRRHRRRDLYVSGRSEFCLTCVSERPWRAAVATGEETLAWFDAHASDYDAWYDTELGRYVDDVEKRLIEELAEPLAGERALDIGCGTGNHTIWLAEKGLTVTGLDESPTMLAVAAGKTDEADHAITWVLGNAHGLPFEENQFDLVISIATMEFIEDRHQVLRDAMRLLKPGGRLVLGLLTRDSPWGEFYLTNVREHPDSVFAKAHFFTEQEIAGLLDAPYTLRKGLYHPPAPDVDRKVAEEWEAKKQALRADRAGFFAVRWVKEKT